MNGGFETMSLKAITAVVSFILLSAVMSRTGVSVEVMDFQSEPREFVAQSSVDWWPMFRHDQNHTGYSTSTAPNTSYLLWYYTMGGVDSSPAVADGRVYVGSADDNVYCLDALTGTKIWNYATGWLVLSSPAVADGKVYVGSWDCNVYCLDALTGAKIWNYTTKAYVGSSPAVADGKVYVGSGDFNVYAFADMPWDITGPTMWTPDGKCDIRDVALIAKLFGSIEGDGKYDSRADITGPNYLVADGMVNMTDIALVAEHYGEICE